ncbi:hypothetical protein [Rubinisphaera brasiliensis]|uniref:Uncharacterized protein n=1 Tax=Rubinisphaera brasiliensis (strain ATCC 49424 / DSM 5305 / JCM 21570 / IAM 15109 / NBRC 103401 / IFAM 1448) TaxID=756272 RepID=F0SQJ2_RUBBR|nr:hypothetical protein [Rubinisphaera brasiliensis]ADY57967.1 hypothetical protein Plabr_0338 [Rubinisphaera brasiliensis DSM 5305]
MPKRSRTRQAKLMLVLAVGVLLLGFFFVPSAHVKQMRDPEPVKVHCVYPAICPIILPLMSASQFTKPLEENALAEFYEEQAWPRFVALADALDWDTQIEQLRKNGLRVLVALPGPAWDLQDGENLCRIVVGPIVSKAGGEAQYVVVDDSFGECPPHFYSTPNEPYGSIDATEQSHQLRVLREVEVPYTDYFEAYPLHKTMSVVGFGQ